MSAFYKTKPVIVQAMQLNNEVKIVTLEGTMTGKPGDWLVVGIEGEIYPCKDSVFKAKYEEA